MAKEEAMKSSWILNSGVGGVILVIAISARGEITGYYNDNMHFSYRVTGLPDFDQRRCDPWHLNCLPGEGDCYCVPTAAADLTAYIANHGFPEVPPGAGNWQHSSLYQDATEVIRDFGELMNTGADTGTTAWGLWRGLVGQDFLPPPTPGLIPLDKFVVRMYLADDDYAPLLRGIAETALWTNGVTLCSYGSYQEFDFEGDLYIVRVGGHCRAVRAIERDGGELMLETRDPWSDADVTFQSTFSTSFSTRESVLVCIGWPPFCTQRWMDKLIPDWATESTRYLDSYLVISPKILYSWDDTVDQIIVINPGYLSYGGPSVSYCPIVADPHDVIMAPDMTKFFVASDDAIGVLDVMDDEYTSFDAPSIQTPARLAFNRQRNLYVLDDGGMQLALVDADADPPVEVAAVELPGQCVALAPDDARDGVALLSPTSLRVYRLPWHLDGTPQELTIPGGLPLIGDLRMCVNRVDGSYIVCSDQYDGLMKFEEDPFSGQLIVTPYSNPELVSPRGMDVDDAGLIYVGVEGHIKVFRINDDDELEFLPDAPLAGMEIGPSLKVAHSRTNYDEAVHGLPEWINEPPQEEPDEAADCLADIEPSDGDGEVNVLDLLAMLASWGPCPACHADLTGDDDVNVLDLLELLAAWGPCS
jgi:hypothetical protein